MFRTKTARLGLAAALTVGVVTANEQFAGADAAPTATDVVGVGSDIVQNAGDFLADGNITSQGGYNSTGNKNRLISIDATADANGRNGFTDPNLVGGGAQLKPTVVLRAGTSPVQRPNGGNAGLAALVADGKNKVSANRISFARSPNLPTEAQQEAAKSNLGSALRTVRIAKDQQVIATATTTNAPPTLTAQQLYKIYTGQVTTWKELNPSLSSEKIVPLIPQTTAGVRNIFLKALAAANNVSEVKPTAATDVQQNDPTSITGLSADEQRNAIVPFPVGRYKLLGSGYFRDPGTVYSDANPAPALTTAGLQIQVPGEGQTGSTGFSAALPYYIIFRQSDYDSTTAWQPGGTLNWVQELFANPGSEDDPDAHPLPFVNTAAGKALLTSVGVTPDYEDLANASTK